jgi:hypothetical protein
MNQTTSSLYLLDLWRERTSSEKWIEAFCDLSKAESKRTFTVRMQGGDDAGAMAMLTIRAI